ncbi:hypothetical protein IEQ34_014032 [Dendrobium chrysotoxum]|uniref:Uncharacterized protein n=1 Tax=Dendrobium chrysotoxum TaxID=161865 RepID=A0AAV7GK23_DENCH|nr:hypothetical protein IEQ34_014032 [Dendrobium chrysotoxum]
MKLYEDCKSSLYNKQRLVCTSISKTTKSRSFYKTGARNRTVLQYEAEFIALAMYAAQLVNTIEEKYYKSLRVLKD